MKKLSRQIFLLAGVLAVAISVQASPITYVDASRLDDSGDGTSWATAKRTVQGGVDAVDVNGTVVVRDGVYTQTSTLNVPKSLTLQAETPGSRPKIELINTSFAYGISINASDVVLENLWLLQNGTASESAMINVPKKSNPWPQPADFQYSDITISGCLVEGGRRGFSGTVEDLTVEGSEFKNNYRDSLYLDGVKGVTNILDNHFSGGTGTKKAIVVENTSDGPYSMGSVNIVSNTCYGKANFFLFNNWPNESDQVDLTIAHNSVDGTGSSAIVLYPTGASATIFDKLDGIDILDNAVTNAGKLAVYVDYEYYTGSDIPADGAILVDNNLGYQNVAGVDDTADPSENCGFSVEAPAGTTLAMFDFIDNLDADPLWADPTHANNNFEFLAGSPLDYAASDGTNIGYWQGHPVPEPASVVLSISAVVGGLLLWRRQG
jgi:hypothetical protein